MLAQLETAVRTGVELVDKASAQNDRWWFLAALAILLCFAAIAIYWLVKSLERKDAAMMESLAKKDAAHELVMQAVRSAHTAERNEWRAAQAESKAGFLAELKQQRTDFRDEMAMERSVTATLVARLLPDLATNTPSK